MNSEREGTAATYDRLAMKAECDALQEEILAQQANSIMKHDWHRERAARARVQAADLRRHAKTLHMAEDRDHV